MDDVLINYFTVAATLTLGSAVQCAVGFGSGLIMTPLLLLAGWSLPETIAICIVAGAVQNIWGAVKLHDAFDWKTDWRPNAIRLAALPIGVAALYAMETTVDPSVVKQTVGGVVLVFVAMLATGRIARREHVPFGWELLAMSSGGFLAGFCGMGGPPIVLWIAAHNWPGDRARSFMFHTFALTLLPQAVLIIWAFGEPVLVAGGVALLAIPWAYLGARLGLQIGAAMSDQRLRRVTIVLLVAIAASAIIGPWFENESQSASQGDQGTSLNTHDAENSTPKALHITAQGKRRSRATLGLRTENPPYPKRVQQLYPVAGSGAKPNGSASLDGVREGGVG